MGGSAFSTVKENAREQVLSADLVRASKLLSREAQNELMNLGASFAGNPFSALELPLTLVGIAATYTMTLGANAGYFYDASFPGLTSDDSSFLILRWPATVLSFANPDGTNGRIDLVVADPQAADADLVSRNILVDPTTRAITPQNVYKTTNPATVLTVITGTPAGTPVPPAVPAHKVAVTEVYVPPAAADSSNFQKAPRLWRRPSYPMSAMNGPVSGCRLTWDLTVDPTTTSAALSIASASTNRIMIDGEMVEFGSGGAITVSADSTANPFGSAAPATASRPYYVYLCGGRNLPQGKFSTPFFLPVVLVESTVQPDAEGHPSSPITTPRGTTTLGAVYVGLGFVYMNTTNRQACAMANGITYAKGVSGFEILTGTPLTSPQAFSSKPGGACEAIVEMGVIQTANGNVAIKVNPSSMGAPAGGGLGILNLLGQSASASALSYVGRLPLASGSDGVAFVTVNLATETFTVRGYEHGVHRISD